METISFVLPSYNEEANIETVIGQWHIVCEKLLSLGHSAQLIVADDGSKDRTFEILQSLQEQYPLLRPLHKPNTGHGATLLFLYKYAIDRGTDYIFQTDSDGQTLSQEFWHMWKNRHKHDFQIGIRRNRQDGYLRKFVTKILQWVVWFGFHVWVKDANTPFRLMKTDKLTPILCIIPMNYNLTNVAISAIATRWNYNIGWYPITFLPRQGGVNSINIFRICHIGINALYDFFKINKNLQ